MLVTEMTSTLENDSNDGVREPRLLESVKFIVCTESLLQMVNV